MTAEFPGKTEIYLLPQTDFEIEIEPESPKFAAKFLRQHRLRLAPQKSVQRFRQTIPRRRRIHEALREQPEIHFEEHFS